MGKKTKRKTYTSKGGAPSVNAKTVKAMRADKTYADHMLNKLKHWSRGKRVMVTIPNPNKNETNKRFIRVESTHPAAFGPWKREDKRLNND